MTQLARVATRPIPARAVIFADAGAAPAAVMHRLGGSASHPGQQTLASS